MVVMVLDLLRQHCTIGHSTLLTFIKVTVNSLLMNIHDFSYNDFCETINAMREI